jgi:hypothetical protein
MALKVEHEMHRRRLGRNVGVGIALVALVAVIFGLTVVKVSQTGPIPGFDHVVQPQLVPQQQGAGG